MLDKMWSIMISGMLSANDFNVSNIKEFSPAIQATFFSPVNVMNMVSWLISNKLKVFTQCVFNHDTHKVKNYHSEDVYQVLSLFCLWKIRISQVQWGSLKNKQKMQFLWANIITYHNRSTVNSVDSMNLKKMTASSWKHAEQPSYLVQPAEALAGNTALRWEWKNADLDSTVRLKATINGQAQFCSTAVVPHIENDNWLRIFEELKLKGVITEVVSSAYSLEEIVLKDCLKKMWTITVWQEKFHTAALAFSDLKWVLTESYKQQFNTLQGCVNTVSIKTRSYWDSCHHLGLPLTNLMLNKTELVKTQEDISDITLEPFQI